MANVTAPRQKLYLPKGPPRKYGVERHPGGQIKKPSESERATKIRSTALAAKLRPVNADGSPKWSYTYEDMDECHIGKTTKTSSVYVIAEEDGWCVKIGRSDNPAGRCKHLQVASSCRLNVAWACRGFYDDIVRLEREVHNKLRKISKIHRNGEWYRMGPDVAVSAIEFIAKHAGIEVYRDISYGRPGYLP